MIRTYIGGLLAVAGAFVSLTATSSGQVVFSDDFNAADGTTLPGRTPTVGQAWTQTAGAAMTIQNGGIATNGGGRTAFGVFSQAFTGTKRLIRLTVDFASLTHNLGYAGVSLFDGSTERIFLGDLSGSNDSIGYQVNFGTAVYAAPVTPNGVVTLLYDWDTGRTNLYAGNTISGTTLGTLSAPAHLNLDRLRIQNGNNGDVGVSSVEVEMLDQGPASVDQFSVDLPIARPADAPVLGWTTSFANQVTITPGGTVQAQGTQTLNLPPGDYSYQITASDSQSGSSATATTPFRSVVGGSATYRYVRFETIKSRNPDSTMLQLSDFNFYNEDTAVTPVAVTNPGGSNAADADEGAAKLLDSNPTTKWLDRNRSYLVFDFGTSPSAFNRYTLTTGNDGVDRDPVRWIMEGSNDGETWTLIDNVTAFDFPLTTSRSVATFPIPLPGVSLTPYLKLQGSATQLVSGDPLVLTYRASGAQTLTLNNGTTTTPLTAMSGSITVQPSQSTTYTLTATGPNSVAATGTYQTTVISPAISTIAYADFDSAGNELALVGAAQIVNDFATLPLPGNHKRLRVTTNAFTQSNSVWFRKRQSLAQGFETTFGMHITRTDSGIGADGMAFVIQNSLLGSDLQVKNAENGTQTSALTIGFDTYANPNSGEPSSALLRIASAGQVITTVDLTTIAGLSLRGTARLMDPTGQAAPYLVRVVYTPGSLSVYMDDVLVASNIAVDLTALGAVDANGTAYVGFAARTGDLTETHDITSWTLTTGSSSPTPLRLISSSINTTTNEVTLTWASSTSKSYRVTTSADLSDWSGVLRASIPGAQTQTTATIPFTRGSKGFFRVEEE